MPGSGQVVSETAADASRARRRRERRGGLKRWAGAIFVTAFVHGSAFMLLTVPEETGPAIREVMPRVTWLGRGAGALQSAVGEQLFLFDQAPLFFPTDWNYSPGDAGLFGGGQTPAEAFGYYEERLAVDAGESPDGLLVAIPGVSSPLDAIRGFPWPYLSAMGRIDHARAVVPPRQGSIAVRDQVGGEPLFTTEVPVLEVVDWPDWRPFDMLVLVGDTGIVGEPLVVPRGSGAAEVDVYFREYVSDNLNLDLHLPPGYYRVSVGP